MHGNKIEEIMEKLGGKIKIIIRAHWHPAISLIKDAKKEKYKCFLVGKYKDKKMVFVPSFLPIVEGTDVREREGLGNFNCYVVGDKTYDFGKVKNLI